MCCGSILVTEMKLFFKSNVKDSAIPLLAILSMPGIGALAIKKLIEALNGVYTLDSMMRVPTSLIMGLLFFIFTLCFAGKTVFASLKQPKRYSATLLSKSSEIYKRNEITVMTFRIRGDGTKLECYSKGSNGLQVGVDYDVLIEGFMMKRVVEESSGHPVASYRHPPQLRASVFFECIRFRR